MRRVRAAVLPARSGRELDDPLGPRFDPPFRAAVAERAAVHRRRRRRAAWLGSTALAALLVAVATLAPFAR